jgi:hypothetical protein
VSPQTHILRSPSISASSPQASIARAEITYAEALRWAPFSSLKPTPVGPPASAAVTSRLLSQTDPLQVYAWAELAFEEYETLRHLGKRAERALSLLLCGQADVSAPPGTPAPDGGCCTTPNEAAGSLLRVGSGMGHRISHATPFDPDVVAPSRSRASPAGRGRVS